MADTTFDAILKFFKNAKKSNGDGKYVSTRNGIIVFTSKRLEDLIDSGNLLGKSIRVICTNFGNHFVASIPPDFSGIIEDLIEPPKLNPFNLPCEFVIDTANFLNSVVASSYTDPVKVIDGILGKFNIKPDRVNFFYSPQEIKMLLDDFVILSTAIESDVRSNWKLINAPEKVIINDNGEKSYKSNVDMALAMYVSALTIRTCLSNESGAKTLVICSGDSDLAEASKMWLGMKGINDYRDFYRSRQLVIISSVFANNLSLEMRTIANNRNCQLILVEDL
jgi:hypothetical protein